jgi:hypothetical protein
MLTIAGGIILAFVIVSMAGILFAVLFGGRRERRTAKWAEAFNKQHPRNPDESWEPKFGSDSPADDD